MVHSYIRKINFIKEIWIHIHTIATQRTWFNMEFFGYKNHIFIFNYLIMSNGWFISNNLGKKCVGGEEYKIEDEKSLVRKLTSYNFIPFRWTQKGNNTTFNYISRTRSQLHNWFAIINNTHMWFTLSTRRIASKNIFSIKTKIIECKSFCTMTESGVFLHTKH